MGITDDAACPPGFELVGCNVVEAACTVTFAAPADADVVLILNEEVVVAGAANVVLRRLRSEVFPSAPTPTAGTFPASFPLEVVWAVVAGDTEESSPVAAACSRKMEVIGSTSTTT